MNRRFLLVAAIAMLSHWSTAFAQITIAPTSKMGEPLVATLAIPEVEGQKTSVTLTASEGVGFKQYGNDIPVWPSSGGKFWLQADVQTEIHGSRDVLVPGEKWPEDPADIKRETITFLVDRTTKTHRVEFEVEGGAPVVVQPLAVLAGKDAQKLGTLYAALAPQSAAITSAASFKAVHAKLLADQGLAGNGAAAAIDKRLAPALEPYNAAKLKSVLEEFVAELGSLPPPGPTTTATAATYIYEKDNTAIPVGVSTGLNRLNREKNIRATLFEEDTVDGDGDVPDQYKVPLDAATKAGLPALVVTAGDTVLKVVKDPRTEQQVFEAIAL
jgi:hypothetical protein